MKTAFKFALREIRFAFRHFRIFIACLFLGTAIIAAVGSVTKNIAVSLSRDAQTFLGGDVEIRTNQRFLSDEEMAYIKPKVEEISLISELRAMAHTAEFTDSTLIEMKAVDNHYPMFGKLETSSGLPPKELLEFKDGHWGIVPSEAIATRLNVKVGDLLTIGNLAYQIRGITVKEPDSANAGFQFAPTVIVAYDSMEQTGLITFGTLIEYKYRLRLAPGADSKAFEEQIEAAFPDSDWRVREKSSGGNSTQRFIDRMGQFMTLVGLTALLVGGVGVSNAVHGYLNSKTDTIATFKILGAQSKTIFHIYLQQILIMSAIAISLGLLAGGSLPFIFADFLESKMPITISREFYPAPLGVAAFYSVLISLIFTLWPLAKAKDISARQLFRMAIAEPGGEKISRNYILIIAAMAAIMLGMVFYTAEYRELTAYFIGGMLASFALLLGTGYLVKAGVGYLPRRYSPALRIALSNITRPGNSTLSIILSLGLGLILLTAISLVEYSLDSEIERRVDTDAPSYFFLDIQKAQEDQFKGYTTSLDGVSLYRTVPNLRGRITHIKGVPSEEADISPDVRWMLRGDRGMTFADEVPEDNKLVAGDWWPKGYDGEPEVSISEDMANGMDLAPGDMISVNVLGRNIDVKVRSVRSVDWGTFGINYVLMFDPKVLSSAPFTYVGTIKSTENKEAENYLSITKEFPNVTTVRLKEILENVQLLLMQIKGAIDVMASITIVAGILVLSGAIAAGHKGRIYDSAVLKVVGATRLDILKAYIFEFILLGVATGLVAILLGSVAAYGIVVGIMELEWTFSLEIPLLTVIAAIFITMSLGMFSIWQAMSVRPAQVLRGI
ncbi:MAG: ABC transporter permease [Alphaproteobacteria bacterium]|nr:ABC transporter permease [Alphaproteobacteria bacterium]HPF47091.1 ABC transporter permease [Emcibacteraceae bacterium]